MRQLLLLVPILVVFFSINSFGAVLVEPTSPGEEISMVEQLETQLGRELTRREIRKVKRWERKAQRSQNNEKTTDIFSLLSLVMVLVGALIFILIPFGGVLLVLAGLTFGFIGLSNIRKDPENLKGKGLAIAGLILGFGLLLALLVLIVGLIIAYS